MRDEIIDKLNKLTAKDNFPASECEVVYFMVEARKLLDRLGKDKNFGTLYFYCNWSMHITMHRGVVVDILEKIGNQIEKEQGIIEDKEVYELITFKTLEKQIIGLLSDNGLNNWVSKGDKWNNFKRLLLNVLVDCPLENSVNKLFITKFEYVEKLEKGISYRGEFRKGIKFEGALADSLNFNL